MARCVCIKKVKAASYLALKKGVRLSVSSTLGPKVFSNFGPKSPAWLANWQHIQQYYFFCTFEIEIEKKLQIIESVYFEFVRAGDEATIYSGDDFRRLQYSSKQTATSPPVKRIIYNSKKEREIHFRQNTCCLKTCC